MELLRVVYLWYDWQFLSQVLQANIPDVHVVYLDDSFWFRQTKQHR